MRHMNAKKPVTRTLGREGRKGLKSLIVTAAFALAWVASTGGVVSAASPAGIAHHAVTTIPASPAHPSGQPDFGPNVYVFNPTMPQSDIQATVNAIANQQISNQFGSQRYALLFEPGTYGSVSNPLTFQVGYYTEVAGLGSSPTDVTINGTIDVYNQCFAANNCIALDNFWRSLSNLTINVTGQTGCHSGTDFWAVSQAAPMRRVNLTGGNLSLMDYCSAGPQYASGGFIADSAFSGGTVINGSQQQFIVRNSSLDGWSNGVWNQVFAGDLGAPPQSFPSKPYTTLATSPVTRERPFLYLDSRGKYNVFVPAVQHNSSGTTWGGGPTAGASIPIGDFYIAQPGDPVGKINAALKQGENLILTPGVYDVKKSLEVTRPGTVVLGLGFPTLVPEKGNVTMKVADASGVDLAGMIFDAGDQNSPALLEFGAGRGEPDHHGRHSLHSFSAQRHDHMNADPPAIQDVFFRIGGATPGKATNSLLLNGDNTIVDDVWAWRADHGNGVGWNQNTADTGVIVNGNNVTAYGLFVEHYQKYQTIWNGQGGTDIFYQSEMPYDPPSQAAWMAGSTTLGYPSFAVSPRVKTFQGYGMGVYCFFDQEIPIHASTAIQVPVTTGVQLHDLLTVFLNGSGGIDHVVNNTGAPVFQGQGGPSNVVSYP